MADAAAAERHEFQAEVARVLDIVVNSLYSKREIFLRELISNASDACDKLRYEAQLDGALLKDDPDLKITIDVDEKAKRLTVTDNGIGMSRQELIDNLGTIAGSGTAKFAASLAEAEKDKSKKEKSELSLIGQFGVGFYAAFMVADKVEVTSRHAASNEAWRWISDGHGAFEIEEAPAGTPRGTSIELHLKKDAKEYAETSRVRHVVQTYSDHISLPVWIHASDKTEQVNEAAALWTRPKKDITQDQYKEFYRHVGHAFDEPWLTLHNRVEGVIAYTNLLFVPERAPFDLFDPARRHGVKLYVRKVFITDECEGLVPPWLRFLKGVVDSEDLPLNVSREMLQSNPVVAKISRGLVKRVLTELARKAEKAPEDYATFWEAFGPVLKEGIYEDTDRRDELLKLARFRSTGVDGWTSLDDYVSRMKESQTQIFTITGDDAEAMKKSPQLEAFKAKGVEVLLFDHPVDEFWPMSASDYDDKAFTSATRGDIDLDAIAGAEKDAAEDTTDETPSGEIGALIAMVKLALGDKVKDVRPSKRLTDSACCLVADEGDLDMRLQKMLKAAGQAPGDSARILEINAKHKLIRAMAEKAKQDGSSREVEEMAFLLLDQARIIEGEPPLDGAAFARRMAETMARALG
jgi:molecular chaperone HtpG